MSERSDTEIKALGREARLKGARPERLLELAELSEELSRAVAKGAHTPVEVLKRLGRSKDAPTRRAVALHPSTPAEVLEVLSRDSSLNVVKAVVTHPNTPEKVLLRLARHKSAAVRRGLYEQVHWSRALQEAIGPLDDPFLLEAGAMHGKFDPDLAQKFLEEGDGLGSIEFIRWMNLVPSARRVTEFAQHPNPVVRRYAAQFTADPAELERLNADPDEVVRTWAADNPHNSAEQLALLAREPTHNLRVCIINHPKVTPEILDSLKDDKELCRTIAESPVATPELLLYLFKQAPDHLRPHIAKQARFPVDELAKFAQEVLEIRDKSFIWQAEELLESPQLDEQQRKQLQERLRHINNG